MEIIEGEMKDNPRNLGILAFGSLIDDPGEELKSFIVEKVKNVKTPFKIEYGRTSNKRGGAPTLIPVSEGGVEANATLLILSDELEINEAKNMLYRRELDKVGSDTPYIERLNPKPNQLVIGEHKEIINVRITLTANFGKNLAEITPEILANLAIKSYESDQVAIGRDGISYLNNNILNGIITPLTEEYKNSILRKMKAKNLEEILKR